MVNTAQVEGFSVKGVMGYGGVGGCSVKEGSEVGGCSVKEGSEVGGCSVKEGGEVGGCSVKERGGWTYSLNKKGNIGRIIMGAPLLILLFFVMVGYVGAAAVISSVKNVQPLAVDYDHSAEILFRDVEVGGEKMPVLIAYILFYNEEDKINEISEQIKPLLNEELNCFALAIGNSPEPGGKTGYNKENFFLNRKDDGAIDFAQMGYKPNKFADYRKKNLLKNLKAESGGNVVYVEYYYGRCLE